MRRGCARGWCGLGPHQVLPSGSLLAIPPLLSPPHSPKMSSPPPSLKRSKPPGLSSSPFTNPLQVLPLNPRVQEGVWKPASSLALALQSSTEHVSDSAIPPRNSFLRTCLYNKAKMAVQRLSPHAMTNLKTRLNNSNAHQQGVVP